MNENTEYEKLSQEIYQTLIDEQGLTINVQHNKKIRGKACKHQIDVFWEYTIAGIENRVAIECKNYSNSISLGRVRDFFGVLHDTGISNGIMITRVGYQKGAKEFAEHYGIYLKILREPVESDWNGRVKTIVTEIEAISFDVKNWKINVDKEWMKAKFGKSELPNIKIHKKTDEIWIKDAENNKLKSFYQLQNELPYNENKKSGLSQVINFDNGFIDTENYGIIKIKGIEITYNINSTVSKSISDGQEIAKAILKDVKTNEIKFIRK